MHSLHDANVGLVVGGGGMPGMPDFPWPSRDEVERQIEQLMDFLEEQERRAAVPPNAR